MKNISFLYLAFAVVSFSLYEVISKTIGGNISAIQLTVVRFFVGGMVLLPLAISSAKKRKLHIGIRDILTVAGLAFLNVCFSMLVIQIGMKYTLANISAIIISANPIFVALFSSIFLKEKLTATKSLGLIIGIMGVIIALGFKQAGNSDHIFYGICLQVLGMLAFSIFTVLGKKTVLKLGSMVFNSMAAIIGSLLLLPIALLLGENPLDFNLGAIWPQMIYFCLINSGLAFYFYFKALEGLDTSLGSMTFFIKPVLASILAAIFLGESLTIAIAIGLVLILIGMFLVKKNMDMEKRNIVIRQVDSNE